MNIKFINVDLTNAYEVVKENIYACKTISKPIVKTNTCHQLKMEDVPEVLKNGFVCELNNEDNFNEIDCAMLSSRTKNKSGKIRKRNISPKQFMSLDLTILKILNYDFNDVDKNTKENKIKLMIYNYNQLRSIALALKQNNLDIQIREVSDEVITLNPEKVLTLPYIQFKNLI